MKTVRLNKLNGKHAAQFVKAALRHGKSLLFYVVRTYPKGGGTYGEFHRKDISDLFRGVGCKTKTVLVSSV